MPCILCICHLWTCYYTKPITKWVSFEILLRKILQIAFWEQLLRRDNYFSLRCLDLDPTSSKLVLLAIDFYAFIQESLKGISLHDAILSLEIYKILACAFPKRYLNRIFAFDDELEPLLLLLLSLDTLFRLRRLCFLWHFWLCSTCNSRLHYFLLDNWLVSENIMIKHKNIWKLLLLWRSVSGSITHCRDNIKNR